MRLSVVIVNYNVRAFLEQALLSVRTAMQGIEGEVWVVDNHSTDNSVPLVRERFPEVRLIANSDNPGFAVANNQAIRQSTGEYVLLLNPDTLVEADTFQQCLRFMDAHPDAGALGVKMLDGSGKFLPESKRGFPSPWVAFCKTVGLSAFFPKSRLFNGYYLGHLRADETNPVDVLAGCFMFMRREALNRAGLLDEAFFMYGEDIDLSYRIQQAGYQNYYFPDTRILHYKGESTKKGSLNYVRTFYQAMIIFTRKHFRGRRAGLFILMLHAAIWLRASMTLLANAAHRVWLPVVDAALLYGGLFFLQDFWANYYYKDPDYFKPAVLWFNFPLYTLVWLLSVWLNGGYDRRYDMLRLLRGIGLGTLLLAAIYGFLDLQYRPSRALLLLGGAWAALSLVALRALLHLIEFRNLHIGRERIKNLLVVGSPDEGARVQELLKQAGVTVNLIGLSPAGTQNSKLKTQNSKLVVTPAGGKTQNSKLKTQNCPDLLPGTLPALVRIFRVDEIIFCSKDLPVRDILDWMVHLGPRLSYKIVPEGSRSIIGSSSKDEPGELYTADVRYNIAQPGQRRNKRVFDLGVCLLLLPTLPLWLLFSKNNQTLLRCWWPVLRGRKTWVGYAPAAAAQPLPPIGAGAFSTISGWQKSQLEAAVVARLNFLYARDWNVWRDLGVLWRAVAGRR